MRQLWALGLGLVLLGCQMPPIGIAHVDVEAERSASRVTYEAYQEIGPRHTLADVAALLGGEGELDTETPPVWGISFTVRVWNGVGGAIILSFRDDLVVRKAQTFRANEEAVVFIDGPFDWPSPASAPI